MRAFTEQLRDEGEMSDRHHFTPLRDLTAERREVDIVMLAEETVQVHKKMSTCTRT